MQRQFLPPEAIQSHISNEQKLSSRKIKGILEETGAVKGRACQTYRCMGERAVGGHCLERT